MTPGSIDSLERMTPAELIGLVRRLLGEVERLRGENEKLSQAVARLRVNNQTLKDEIARLKEGRRLVGRKIGLTSLAVQRQLGVDQPDYGMPFHDMAVPDGWDVSYDQLIQPKVEAEVAFV